MKTKAAVLWGLGQKWEVEEVELDKPKAKEVLVKLTASGLCHSDEHLVTGDLPMPLPVVGGHEGAGVVVEVGEGVTDVAEGLPGRPAFTCPQSDSNRHWADFKSAASANWAMGARQRTGT